MSNKKIEQLGKGAVPDKLDTRDYRYELIAGAQDSNLPKEFSLKDKISRIESQGKSSSCVGQTFSYYAEVLNKIETDNDTQLSARDIYSKIYLDGGGSYLREGAKKLTKSGIVLEEDAPSYIKDNPPTEAFMRQRNDITEEEVEKGNTYLAKSYMRVRDKSFDNIKKAIYNNNGCVIGVRGDNDAWDTDGIVGIPNNPNWGHAILLIGWKEINGKEYLEFVNSWGDDWGNNGYGYLSKEYIERFSFNPWTITDYPNSYYQNLKKKISILKRLILYYKKLIENWKGKNV